MARISVGHGKFVEVDDADWAEVVNLSENWHLSSWGYARSRFKGNVIYLHKLIYSLVDPTYKGLVDHEDQDPLNCKRDNLRPATLAQNRANGSVRSDNISGIPGVSWNPKRGKWRVRVSFQGVKRYDETFDTLEEAVKARQEAAEKYHGDFRKEL